LDLFDSCQERRINFPFCRFVVLCELGGKGRKLPLSPSSPLNPKIAARITGSYIVDNKHFALMCCAPCGKNAPDSTAAIRNALTISAI